MKGILINEYISQNPKSNKTIKKSDNKEPIKVQVSFWKDKIPCWEFKRCLLHDECPAYIKQLIPCWEHKETICERTLKLPRVCDICRIHNLYYNDRVYLVID
jgi:hypothetical protein